eukprot:2506252-Rhodomonas_salina.1
MKSEFAAAPFAESNSEARLPCDDAMGSDGGACVPPTGIAAKTDSSDHGFAWKTIADKHNNNIK